MVRTAASLSLTSWSESDPWCGGSRMTSPSSTLDWLLNVYCNIHQDHRQINVCRSPQARVTRMLMTVNSGNPQQQQVCVQCGCLCVCVCVSECVQFSFSHPWAGERCGWKDFGCAVKSSRKLRQRKVQQKVNKWEGSFSRGTEWPSLASSPSTWPKRKRLRRQQPKVCSSAASS